MARVPSVILIFSGKRKSGKDYITNLLQERLGKDKCSILRLSAPLKGQYAIEHHLDYDRLLDASDYKERYRADMIRWGEDRRRADPGFFARVIASGPGSEMPVWLISDARRQSDVAHFRQSYTDGTLVVTVRVTASEATRRARGWVFTAGVDDAESECGLDEGVDFQVTIGNDSESEETVNDEVKKLVLVVREKIDKDAV